MVSKSQVKAHDAALEKALKRFKDSWDYASSHWHGRWDRDTQLYDNERVNAQYKGVTDTFVPMVFSTVETMVAALNNANLRFDFKSSDPMRQASTAPLNALIDEWWDDGQWDLALEEMVREMLTTGMAAATIWWDGDKPRLEQFSMRDAIIDPTITSPAQLQLPGYYAGRRKLVRKGSYENLKVVDLDEKSKHYGELIKRFDIPDEASGSTAPDPDDDKSHKELMSGSTLPDPRDQDEIIEIVDIDKVVTMLNRKFVIEETENPFKTRHRLMLMEQYRGEGMSEEDAKKKADEEAKGLVNYFFLRNYRKSSLFYAKSEIDAIAKPQELLNDMTNMEADYIIRQLSPQRELDPKYTDWLDLITNDPDVTYPFIPGSLVDRQVPVLPANSFNNRMNIKNEIRETTAVDQLAKGIANVKQTTATEVDAQLSQTSQRIESKARIIEKDGLYWMAYIVFKCFQLFVDEKLVVEVKGQDASELRTTVTNPQTGEEMQLPKGAVVLDPADYQGTWRPKVTLEVDAQSKRAEEQKVARENFQIIIQDPTNNLEEAKQIMYPKMLDLDREEIERITTPDPNQQMPMAPGEAGLPVDEATPPESAGQLPTAPGAPVTPPEAAGAPLPPEGDVDVAALQGSLTPDEIAELQAALAAENARG